MSKLDSGVGMVGGVSASAVPCTHSSLGAADADTLLFQFGHLKTRRTPPQFREWAPGQNHLSPPSPRDWLPQNHLIYFLLDVCEQIDISPILDDYHSEQGEQPPIHPRMMLVLLAERYLAELRLRINNAVASSSQEAMQALIQYSCPGNIRELINVVERVVLLCEGSQITLADLPRTIVLGPRSGGSESNVVDVLSHGDWRGRTWKDVRDALVRTCEQAYFVEQLTSTTGNLDETARSAGINPRSLFDLMRRHGMKKEDVRGVTEAADK